MKLLVESNEDFEYITESAKDGKKNYYIHGPFMQSELINRNRRVYPRAVMETAVNKYIDEFVTKNRGAGELNHPNTPALNPDRISHLVTELYFDENNVMGKAKILEDTVCGKQAKALIEGGFNLGISSRSLGSLKEGTYAGQQGIKIVQPDLVISCLDLVATPSGPDCYLTGIMEEAEWVMLNGEWVQNNLEEAQQKIRKASRKDVENVALQIFENYINRL
jgi:hypothetical protein